MDIIYIDTEMYGAQFGFDVSSNLAIEARVRYNDVAHAMDNFSLREAPAPMTHRLNRADGSGSQFFLAGTLEKGNSTFAVGVDGLSASHESVITNPHNVMFRVDNFINVERDLLGAFAEAQIGVVNGELELGLRYNQVNTNAGDVAATGMMGMMGDLVGQLATAFNSADRDINWNMLDAVIKYRRPVSASTEWIFEVGSKSRAPSYQELYLWLPMQATGGLADGRTYIGNLDLREERSNEVVVGVSALVGAFAISPQVFYRRVDDYIQGVPSTNMTANRVAMMMSGKEPLQFDNVDAEIWGFDAAWSYVLTDSLLLDGIVSLARGQRRDINDDLYRLSPLNGSVGLTYSAESWSLKSEIVGYADQNRVSMSNDEIGTSGYWLLNLGYTWQPLASLRVEARVDNLLDETYQNHVTGINRAAGSDIPVGERLFGVERTLSAGLVYSF
jgi:iron complex outermembrane receptor protein